MYTLCEDRKHEYIISKVDDDFRYLECHKCGIEIMMNPGDIITEPAKIVERTHH